VNTMSCCFRRFFTTNKWLAQIRCDLAREVFRRSLLELQLRLESRQDLRSIRQFWDSVSYHKSDRATEDIYFSLWIWLNPDVGPDPILDDPFQRAKIRRCLAFLDSDEDYCFGSSWFAGSYNSEEKQSWPFSPSQKQFSGSVQEMTGNSEKPR
jgi:hypothetical protein